MKSNDLLVIGGIGLAFLVLNKPKEAEGGESATFLPSLPSTGTGFDIGGLLSGMGDIFQGMPAPITNIKLPGNLGGEGEGDGDGGGIFDPFKDLFGGIGDIGEFFEKLRNWKGGELDIEAGGGRIDVDAPDISVKVLPEVDVTYPMWVTNFLGFMPWNYPQGRGKLHKSWLAMSEDVFDRANISEIGGVTDLEVMIAANPEIMRGEPVFGSGAYWRKQLGLPPPETELD